MRDLLKIIAVIFLLIFSLDINGQDLNEGRERIDLSGIWKVKTDSANIGLKESWQDSTFKQSAKLPGTLEENQIGTYLTKGSTSHLSQTWQYTGAAWFQKEIDIPESWADKQLELYLERTKVTKVWVDSLLIGSSTLLSAPQVYPVTGRLSPGKHKLTILVNNSPYLVSVGGSHAISEHTQTNWNGIIGEIYLKAIDKIKIERVRITPDIINKVANVQADLVNYSDESQSAVVELQVFAQGENPAGLKPAKFTVKLKSGSNSFNFSYPLGKEAALWSEFNPNVYRLVVNLHYKRQLRDSRSFSFGLRSFKSEGLQFKINDVITFLRGKNDACIFPLTGYPPTDTASWRRLYRTAKMYGINHYRFHSYTPPEAAFEAADAEGIYIQAELPNWADFNLKDTVHTNFQYQEGKAILDAYGNHPSFVLFSLGNELGGDRTIHDTMVSFFRQYDGRRLYASGTNAFYADPRPGKGDDFWVTMRTGKETSDRVFDVRGSFATTEDPGSGIINSVEPSTRLNFASALKGVSVPVVSHEIGQYQIYPDFKEIPEYKGVLRPLNFEIFKDRLQKAGMGDQAADFFKASGMLSALLYREEIEMALRTSKLAGFQLLDLQDFPGQGTALVGLLNAFMQNKGIIPADEFRSFSNSVVIQLLMDKYIWTNNQTYEGDVQIVNYSPVNITATKINWSVTDQGGSQVLFEGIIPVTLAKNGGNTTAGKITFPMGKITKASKLLIKLEIPGTRYKITYPVWVYPGKIDCSVPSDITVADSLSERIIEILNYGGKVLLFPDHNTIKEKSVSPQFISEFWNWLVFKNGAERLKRPVSAGTLGILAKPEHPLLKYFPTEYYSDWQWWSLTKNARPLILDQTEPSYRPIVQVIDNIDRNHKLGMIFEFKTGKGKLLISMINLPALLSRPEARQLYNSILRYMESDEFSPSEPIGLSNLKGLL